MPKAKSPVPKTRFSLRSRRVFVYAALLIGFGIYLYCGGASNYAASRTRAALARRDLDSAQEWLDFADWLGDRQAEIAFLKARIHRKRGELEETRRWLAAAQKLGWDKEAVRREEIILFAQVGQMRQAEPWLSELILSPGDDGQEICEAFVNGFYLNQDLRKADALITSWIGDFPEDPQPWVFRAKMKLSADKHGFAEEDFRQALNRDPKHPEALIGLGEALLRQLRPEEALAEFRQCMNVDPSLHEARAGAARALIVLGKSEEALVELDRILEAKPDHAVALLERGKLHLAAAHNDVAVKDFEALCRLRAGGVAHRYQLALALRAAGRDEESKEHFQYVNEGQAALRRADEISFRVSDDPTSLETRTELGIIYLKYSDPIKGLAWLRAVLSENPENRPALAALATYYRSCSHLDEQFSRFAEYYEAARDRVGPEKTTPEPTVKHDEASSVD